MNPITSAQNPKLKKAIRLHESRGRRQQGRIIIFGVAEIRRAIDCNVQIDELFFCPDLIPQQTMDQQLDSVNRLAVFQLPIDLFERLAFGQRTDGMVATAIRPNTNIDAFRPLQNALVVVLEAIEKPGNIGAVFRSACAAGVDAVVLANPLSDVFHPNAIRSSLGSVFAIPTFCDSSERVKQILIQNHFLIATTRVDATTNFTNADLSSTTAIVLGNESKGLSDVWTGPDLVPVTIPMRNLVDSLNIAMTSTLMVFESRRQRDLLRGK